MKRLLPVLLLLACQGGAGLPDDTPPADDDDPVVDDAISAEQAKARALRVSMALRGQRPALEELDAIATDPASLDAHIDDWLSEPAFGETIRHLHADTLLTRTPQMFVPPLGPLTGRTRVEIGDSLSEEPLALVEHVVMGDRPYTEIVTADYTVVDALAPDIFDGVLRSAGDGDQVASFTDGRPAAGILSTNGLWVRHISNGQNYNRARANAVSDALLCTDFLDRDIPISGDVDLSDPDVVADALTSQPECVSCHQSLDPLASHFFPMRARVAPFQIIQAYQADCGRGNNCYPLPMYNPRAEGAWRRFSMRPPGYFGSESADLGSLGQQIADDPRFAQCTVERFVSYFTQTPREELDLEVVAPLQQRFVDSGYDARDLVRAIVTDPSFADVADPEGAGLLAARPFQLARTLEDLTGFRFVVNIDGERCRRSGNNCRGDVDVVFDDTIGFRAMAGGIDGYRVTKPTWTTTPTKTLFLAALAEEAAGFVVDNDFGAPAAERRLLRSVEPATTDEAAIRAQLVQLHRRLYAEEVAVDDVQIDEAWSLFQAALSRRGTSPRDVADAWKVTLTGLLQDPRLLLY